LEFECIVQLQEKVQLWQNKMQLLSLSEKISFLLGNWGFLGQAHSDALSMAYENFLIKVGLYGTPLKSNYNDYGHLATEATWF
jgi:hypothetical protein